MPGQNKLRDTGCPIAFALDTFGDRWSLIIIRDMLMKGFRTYGEFQNGDEKIATNVLAAKLRELEALDIVSKQRDPENRRRILYQLTKKGADLAPVLLEMIRWSGKYDSNTKVKKTVLGRIRNDREEFADELKEKVLQQYD